MVFQWGSIGRLANFDRRPFSLEFDGIVKIFAKPANWPQNAVPLRAANFMCWFYGLSSEFYVRYQMLTRIRVQIEETQLHYLSAYTKQAAFIEWEPLKKEEFRSLVRESYYDFPVYEESLSHLGQTQY